MDNSKFKELFNTSQRIINTYLFPSSANQKEGVGEKNTHL